MRRRRRGNNSLVIAASVVLMALLFIIIVIMGRDNNVKNPITTENGQTTTTTGMESESTTEEPTEPPTEAPVEISLIAVGDNLIHEGVIKSGKQSDGTYNFDFMFTNILDYIGNADISVINQETVFGGDDKAFAGYPNFNSPTAIGDAIVNAGFNVVLHASNHARDMGKSGLLNCVKYWKTQPSVTMLGIYETPEEGEDIKIVDIAGSTNYYRDENDTHIVPKRTMDELIINGGRA